MEYLHGYTGIFRSFFYQSEAGSILISLLTRKFLQSSEFERGWKDFVIINCTKSQKLPVIMSIQLIPFPTETGEEKSAEAQKAKQM